MTAVNTDAPSTGRGPRDQPGFIQRHGLWDQGQEAAAEQVREQIEAKGLRHIRLSWCDQHGIARGKTLTVKEAMRALREGKDFQFVTALFDTTNHPIVPPFQAGGFPGVPELDGLPDGVLVPDPATFRELPWVEDTGWMLCDAYFSNGKDVPRDFPLYDELSANASGLIFDGGSGIVSPEGIWVSGPAVGREGLVTAHIDRDVIDRERLSFDPTGHYSRPDVLSTTVDRRRRALTVTADDP